eukprot:COSAG06_NODE_7630_length_2433_cov_4.677806_3_plen_154_part_00
MPSLIHPAIWALVYIYCHVDARCVARGTGGGGGVLAALSALATAQFESASCQMDLIYIYSGPNPFLKSRGSFYSTSSVGSFSAFSAFSAFGAFYCVAADRAFARITRELSEEKEAEEKQKKKQKRSKRRRRRRRIIKRRIERIYIYINKYLYI